MLSSIDLLGVIHKRKLCFRLVQSEPIIAPFCGQGNRGLHPPGVVTHSVSNGVGGACAGEVGCVTIIRNRILCCHPACAECRTSTSLTRAGVRESRTLHHRRRLRLRGLPTRKRGEWLFAIAGRTGSHRPAWTLPTSTLTMRHAAPYLPVCASQPLTRADSAPRSPPCRVCHQAPLLPPVPTPHKN